MTATRSRTRQDVVAAAGRLFASRGYHGTSMRDLAREVGLLGSSLYSHIDSKADLLVEVVEQGGALFQASADRVEREGGTGADQLAALVEGHVDVVLDHIDEARTFLYEADALDETHRQRVLAARDLYESAFRRVLVAGVQDGSFRADLDPAITAIMILSILNAVERWYRPGGRLDRRQLAREILHFCSTGLVPKET
ncbi:MAG TPA: TetR/AcrR family transcriptional regulator [Acidimicrobiia bacterium]|nr:TetR/AcrR family transcriptional regulator [Acidimicrobiia bacterium]